MNKQPHQQDNPGDAPPVPQVTGFGSPQCVGNEICSLPLSKQLGLCLLFVTWTRTMDGKHSLQEGSSAGTALVQLFLTAQRACQRWLGFFSPLCFVHFYCFVSLEVLCEWLGTSKTMTKTKLKGEMQTAESKSSI